MEVVLVMALFSAVVAVAVPVYLGFQGRKADKSAQTSLIAAAVMAETYRVAHGSYLGMDTVDLMRIDPRLSATLTVASVKRRSYCLADTIHGKTWSIRGPYRGDPALAPNGTCE